MTLNFLSYHKFPPAKPVAATCPVFPRKMKQENFWAEESDYVMALRAVSLLRLQENREIQELDFSKPIVEDKYRNINRDWC
jgi:hypothetical protein